uniref:Surfeit 2 n=1 Tax=Sinocyclocheilus rhinocerous TaxID=307959 RepID=A0A673GIC3_9TELE
TLQFTTVHYTTVHYNTLHPSFDFMLNSYSYICIVFFLRDHLFCKLTLRHINRVPQHVLRHVSGRRYRRALEQYEECVRQGVEFVPVQLKKKKRPKEAAGSEGRAAGSERRASRKQDSGVWTPNSSNGEDSDSSDSMSDLYPRQCHTSFCLHNICDPGAQNQSYGSIF